VLAGGAAGAFRCCSSRCARRDMTVPLVCAVKPLPSVVYDATLPGGRGAAPGCAREGKRGVRSETPGGGRKALCAASPREGRACRGSPSSYSSYSSSYGPSPPSDESAGSGSASASTPSAASVAPYVPRSSATVSRSSEGDSSPSACASAATCAQEGSARETRKNAKQAWALLQKRGAPAARRAACCAPPPRARRTPCLPDGTRSAVPRQQRPSRAVSKPPRSLF
jgi:hypothetical protein